MVPCAVTSPRLPRLTRWIARIVGREHGEVRALQDLLALEGVLRFTLLFGVTVVVPAILLAYFALASIRAEELNIDAGIERRSDSVVDQIHGDLVRQFGSFEGACTSRLTSNQSPLTGLADLSPYLKVAFRFDREGRLVAPFSWVPEEPVSEPSTFYRNQVRQARQLEVEGKHAEAALRYEQAARSTADPSLAGEAEFAKARALRQVDPDASETAYADVYADYATVRDSYGFQLGDLVTLARSENTLARDSDVASVALQELVERLLAARWTIGRPGEAAIARRALVLLEDRPDRDWVARSRVRLEERTEQLFWAGKLYDELQLLVNARASADRTETAVFHYVERPESGTLWATVWWGGEIYAFAFDYDRIAESLSEATQRANQLDPELRANIIYPQGKPSQGAMSSRSLGPWLPSLSITAGPADPTLLAQTKARKRWVRITIILIAVGMSVVGVIIAARLLGRELEGARMKADFAANVSHELRSPITQIRLKGEALQLGLVYDDDDRQAHYDAVVREAERLSRLVDNVLDFSTIEQGAKKYLFRPEDLGEIIRNTVEAGRNAVESRGLDMEVTVPEDLPVVWVDREAIAQVLTNLLSNAAKYGAAGGWVGISARVQGNHVEMAVRDRGAGIAFEDQSRIFERFYRSSDPSVRRNRGTGIGLTIVRYIVQEHGGEIRVDSAPGKGTTFTITFPLQPREAGA